MIATRIDETIAPPLEAEPHTKLVLVVDDDPDARLCLEMMVRRHGFRVETASNGREALSRVHAEPPDMIIMDLMMPELGGYEATLALPSVVEKRIPVVLHTVRQIDASTLDQMRTEAFVVGMVRKPANFQLLIDLLHTTLRTRRLIPAL